jgi:hypothetical protein
VGGESCGTKRKPDERTAARAGSAQKKNEKYGRQGLQIWAQELRQDKQTSSTQNEDQKDRCLLGKISTVAGIETALVGGKPRQFTQRTMATSRKKCAAEIQSNTGRKRMNENRRNTSSGARTEITQQEEETLNGALS